MKTVFVNGKKYYASDIEEKCSPVKLEVKPGYRVKHRSGEEYIVAQVSSENLRLISLRDGNRWDDCDLFHGEEDQFELIQS